MDKLVPCPFCGGSGETVHDSWASRDFWGVACQGKCLVFLDSRCGSEAQAAAAWNRRAPAAPDPALLALARLSARLIHRGQQPGFGLGELLSADASDSGVLDDDGFLAPGVAIAIRALLAPDGAGEVPA